MDDTFEISIDNKSCKELLQLKDVLGPFKVEPGTTDSNIFEQKGGSYTIPFPVLTHIGIDALSNAFEEQQDEISTSEVEEFKYRSVRTPIDEVMHHMEQARLACV